MKKRSGVDKVVILIIITVFFYALILVFSDINQVIEKIFEINLIYFPIIFGLQAVQVFVSAIKFHRLLLKIGINIPFMDSLKIFLSGIFMGMTPGATGVIIKSYFLKKNHGTPISSSFPILLVERWTEVLAILLIMTVLLFWSNLYETKIILFVGYSFFGVTVVMAYNARVFSLFKKLGRKIKYLERFTHNLDESRKSLNILTKPQNFTEALGLTLIAKSLQLFVVYFIFLSVGIDLGIFDSGQIYYTSLLAGALTFLPAGIVVTESGMIGLLLKYNITFSLATLGVLIVRFITTWMGMIIGVIAMKFVLKDK